MAMDVSVDGVTKSLATILVCPIQTTGDDPKPVPVSVNVEPGICSIRVVI